MNNLNLNEHKEYCFIGNEKWPDLIAATAKRKLILLIPHTLDEAFDYGQLLQQWIPFTTETLIVYLGRDQGTQIYVDADQKAKLARAERLESKRALHALELAHDVRIRELNIANSDGKGFEQKLENCLRYELDSSSVLIAPEGIDRHGNRDVVGDCAARLAASIGFEIYFYPCRLQYAPRGLHLLH